MIEELITSVSWKTALVAVVAFYVCLSIARSVQRERRIQQLGGHAPIRPSWYPLGADFIVEAISYAKTDRNLRFWEKNLKKFGNPANPTTLEANGGGQRIVFTVDPENIKAILATQFNDYGKGPKFNEDWHAFLGDSIFATDGDKWHDSRQLIRPQFIKDRVSDLVTFERHVQVLLDKLGGNGEQVDVKDWFFRYTLDAATDFLLGRSVESLNDAEAKFAESFAEIQRVQSLIARAGPLNWAIPRASFNRHLKVLNEFVDSFIDDALRLSPDELEKRTKSDEGYTFLHAIASYTRDRKVLRDQLVAVLLAGRDTTACTLSWLFYHLAREPTLVADLRAEIERVVGFNRPPTYTDLKNMKLVQNTLNETLRMYPAVPFNVRVALKDTTLPHGGGPNGDQPIGILKDTPIGYSTLYLQHSESIYPETSDKFPDPLTFAPRRWEHWQPKMWTFIPFNGGPRICVGQQFALTEMGYTLVRMLQRFSRIEPRGQVSPDAVYPPYGSDAEPIGGNARNVREASLVERAGKGAMKMQCDIVLQPAEAVNVAFYNA